MIKKLLLFLMLLYCGLLFLSCSDITYNSDDRIVFEGYVKRQDGGPIQDIPVYIYVYGNSDRDNISYTTTGRDGHYRMIFPKPNNFNNISLLINTYDAGYGDESPQVNDSTFSNYSLSNILPKDINPYHIDFGNTVLYNQDETTTLTVNFITEGATSWDFPITGYEGLFADSGTYYNPPESEYEPYPGDPNYETYYNYNPGGMNYYYYLQQPDHTTYYRTFSILKNQAFIFKYVNAEHIVTTVNIPIANEPVTYTVNY